MPKSCPISVAERTSDRPPNQPVHSKLLDRNLPRSLGQVLRADGLLPGGAARRTTTCSKAWGIDLIPASAPDFFTEDTPTAVLVRQVLGAIAQCEKATTVAKLKAARDRKRARDGKCEGRKSHLETNPELVALVKRLRRRNPKTGEGRSLRSIEPAMKGEPAGRWRSLGPISHKDR
jgi:hypothetical protein